MADCTVPSTQVYLWLFFFVFNFFCMFFPLSSKAADTLFPNQSIQDGESLVSPGGDAELGFIRFSGYLYLGIWLDNSENVVWVANRDNPVANSTAVLTLTLREDGNLVISDENRNFIWSSNTKIMFNNSMAVLMDSGNLVLREGNYSHPGKIAWQSFDHPSQDLLPGMKVGINLRTGENRMLKPLKNVNERSTGIFSFGFDPQQLNELFIWRRRVLHWRCIFWNGSTYNVMPESSQNLLNFSIVRNEDEVYFMHSSPRTVLNMDIYGDLYLHTKETENDHVGTHIWWSGRGLYCSPASCCGPFSICNEINRPPCKCLPGFKPAAQKDWDSGDWSLGCIRTTVLQCGEEDGFLPLKGVELCSPTHSTTEAANADECRMLCLYEHCRCTAYAFTNRTNAPCHLWLEDLEVIKDDDDEEEDGEEDGESFKWDLNIRLAASELKSTGRQCQSCGTNIIPYPLSTGPDCGDPIYSSFNCNTTNGQLYFRTLNNISHLVTSISPETRTFVIKLEDVHQCSAKRNDLYLNHSLPFYITNKNTILFSNCSIPVLPSTLDCTTSGPCEKYIKEGLIPCFDRQRCCSYSAGDNPSTLHEIGVSKTSCSSYACIINANLPLGVGSLHEGVEISWRPSLEPVCVLLKDCEPWPDSRCLPDETMVAKKRCFCNTNFQWDSSKMNCTRMMITNISNNKSWLILVITLTMGSLSVAILLFCLWKRYRKKASKEKKMLTDFGASILRVNDPMNLKRFRKDGKSNLDIPNFHFQSIAIATENFSDSKKLGQGGFGSVYKGTFTEGQELAVKRLSRGSRQGLEEFKNEVLIIAKLQHMNLVRVLGYCIEAEEKILLYEYMANKSLDHFLFDTNRNKVLDWKKRFNIILGIARGLLYLHQDSRLRIIHRDLKTSNILLDEELNPKISDFGLARIFGRNETEGNTKRVVGTYGYMSPEYAAHGLFSIKSDVFSFGVILLEIVSGKRNSSLYHSENSLTLLGHAFQLWTEERGLDLMDPSLSETCDTTEVLKCIHVGLLCVQDIAADRPTMNSVLTMFAGETPTLRAPKQPAFFLGDLTNKEFPANNLRTAHSRAELTLSSVGGR